MAKTSSGESCRNCMPGTSGSAVRYGNPHPSARVRVGNFSRISIGLFLAMTGLAMAMTASANDIGRGDRYSGQVWASRSPVLAQHGMAATEQPLASQVAIDILKKGGSAVDAAIAANAALGLMEPVLNGIGGDCFVIVWDPKTKQLYGYNGSGPSAKGRDLDKMRAEVAAAYKKAGLPAKDHIPAVGSLPITVPGTVDTWFALHDKFGKLPIWRRRLPMQGMVSRSPSWLPNTGRATWQRSTRTTL